MFPHAFVAVAIFFVLREYVNNAIVDCDRVIPQTNIVDFQVINNILLLPRR